MRLSTVEMKVRNMEGGVKPWVEKRLSDEMREMEIKFE